MFHPLMPDLLAAFHGVKLSEMLACEKYSVLTNLQNWEGCTPFCDILFSTPPPSKAAALEIVVYTSVTACVYRCHFHHLCI